MLRIKIFDARKPEQIREEFLNQENLLNQECLIGRYPNCGLVLNSDDVSRMHGKISYKNNNYYFTDLASRGGSQLNAEYVRVNQDYLITVGDKIQIGRFFLMVMPIIKEDEFSRLAQINNKNTANYSQDYSLKSPQEYMPVAMIEPTDLKFWKKGELTARCQEIINETHDVKTFRFVVPQILFTYKPGEFVNLELKINGEEISRSYSISSTPSRPHSLDITVKRVQNGLMSNWLHDNIKVGDEVKLRGPYGKFTCFANPSPKLLFISAGSGITPMMSMSRWLLDTVAKVDIVFFHSARFPKDIIYRQELELMSARHPNFHLALSTTRHEVGYSWSGLTGRLDAKMLLLTAPDLETRTVYVCGSESFMESTKQILESIGFPMQNYYEESFGAPRKKPQKTSQSITAEVNNSGLKHLLGNISSPTFCANTSVLMKPSTSIASSSSQLLNNQNTLVFKKSGKEVICDGEENILSIAELEGVKIRNSCRAGTCGSCKKLKIKGDLRLEAEPEGLDESEIQEGYILTCISYPQGKVVIDA
ncbi:flavodoxin [Calothrix sp. HK-06]|nr:flavodoxin [Calothrix sp. HK-06]